MFKLIRDNVPELMRQSGQVCNFASIENDELFMALLRSKLIEEVNEFLASGDVGELVDVKLVIDTLLSANGISEEQFKKLYDDKLKAKGGFERKYIGFFQDTQQDSQQKD